MALVWGRLAVQAPQQSSGLASPTPVLLCAVRGVARSHKKLEEFNLCARKGIQRYLHALSFTRASSFVRGFVA